MGKKNTSAVIKKKKTKTQTKTEQEKTEALQSKLSYMNKGQAPSVNDVLSQGI